MEKQKYCVYNQTSECFLSFGVHLEGGAFVHLKRIFRRRPQVSEEGCWIIRPKAIHTLGMFSSRDLVYLDKNYRVLEAVETPPSFRITHLRSEVASLLVLPVHTIYSSQTQPGNQLVISVAEEMPLRLSTMTPPVSEDASNPGPAIVSSLKEWTKPGKANSRQTIAARNRPELVVYNADGTPLNVQGVRDITSSGLYLMTEERWPMGTQVAMTLKRMDAANENVQHPITVELRVTRWGDDGIGLAFVQPEVQESVLTASTG